jgi:hypothetical protein
MRQRQRDQRPPRKVFVEHYAHGVIIRIPAQGLGEALNRLHETARQISTRVTIAIQHVGRDEQIRFGFKSIESATAFRAEADKIVPGLVERSDGDRKR